MKKMILHLFLLLYLVNLVKLGNVYAQPTPIIKVEPEINVRSSYAVWPNYVNETFEVNITINEVVSEQKLVAADFFLTYNKTLLEVVSVKEGPFFQDPRWNLSGTLFIYFVEELPDGSGVVKAMNLIYPNFTTGNYDDWIMFPNGSGVIAIITFKSIYQPVAPQPSESCILALTESMLMDSNNNEIPHSIQNGIYEVVPLQLPRTPIDVTIDVGSPHFKGEIAEFHILTSDYGKAVNATKIKAYLYYNGTMFVDLTNKIESVTTGLYRIIYTIPLNATFGKYTLLVEAEFFEAKGTGIGSFLVSQTFTEWNRRLITLNGTVAMIETNVGIIRMNVTAIAEQVDEIHPVVVDIDWKTMIATIQTDLGLVKGYVENVDDGGLAIINTPLGQISGDISTILERVPEEPPTIDYIPIWIAVTFSILAFLASIITLLRKK